MLCSVFCNGQNYQCLQPGVKHYFTNSNGYLRGISIDSTRVYPDSTIYFPFHTPRGAWGMGLGGAYFPSPDNSGGCWLGKKVIGLPNGTFLFDNLRGDTIVIRSQANMGDTWTFCRDSSATYYTATITAIDTMNVLGHNDSVKRIILPAIQFLSVHNAEADIGIGIGGDGLRICRVVAIVEQYVLHILRQRGRLYFVKGKNQFLIPCTVNYRAMDFIAFGNSFVVSKNSKKYILYFFIN